MSRLKINLATFVFRSVLKGLWLTLFGILYAVFSVVIVSIIGMSVSELYRGVSMVELRVVTNSISGVLSMIVLLTVTGVFVFGVPFSILPSITGSIILSTWVYRSADGERLNKKSTQVIGIVIGGLGGLIALFTQYRPLNWPDTWIWFSSKRELLYLFWSILIIVPFTGALVGRKLARDLSNELEPKDGYRSIDQKMFQQDQKNDLALDSSTNDS